MLGRESDRDDVSPDFAIGNGLDAAIVVSIKYEELGMKAVFQPFDHVPSHAILIDECYDSDVLCGEHDHAYRII